MQISSRFTIAIHMLTCMETFKEDYKITSDFLASSINVNPVIIRRILSQLRDAGMIEVKRGTGGASVVKPLSEITFLDVYQAVECIEENTLFHFHEIRIRPVRWEKISTTSWMISFLECSRPWRGNLPLSHWKM